MRNKEISFEGRPPSKLGFLIALVLVFRLLISFLPAMPIDMGCWKAWAMRMVEVGPQNFYSTQIFTDNPPGYLYVFWVIGEIWGKLGSLGILGFLGKDGFEWLLKLPANLFDLGTGLLIYKIISHKRGRLSWLGRLGFLGYTLNPAIWFNSSVFGQFDGAGAFFGLLSVYFTIGQIRPIRLIWAGVALAIAWAIKPQAIFVMPGVGILIIREFRVFGGFRWIGEAVKVAAAFLLTTLLLYWPFFPNNPLAGVFYVQQRMTQIYSCTTCYAFNFWGLWGNWLDDRVLWLGIPLLWWGIILGGLGMLGALGRLVINQNNIVRASARTKKLLTSFEEYSGGQTYLAIALSIMSFNMFLTRMHERYVLPFFAFFLIAVILLKSKKLMLFYIFFSFFNLLNVYYPYAFFNKELSLTPGLVVWLGENFRLLSGLGVLGCLGILGWYLFDRFKGHSLAPDVSRGFSKGWPYEASREIATSRFDIGARNDVGWSRKEVLIVFLLVFVSFLIRVIRLDTPKTYYFDEVYHAFTAVEMEKGNRMAWEWWNTPPKGFAYEWTHPPLAKEAMVLGIRGMRWIRGIGGFEGLGGSGDAFGWRIPGVLAGTGVIFLIYLLGRNLFNKRVGLLAAAAGACDGLLFTQSRIGMNDIYFLFFMMLAVWLFVRYRAAVAHGQFSAVQNLTQDSPDVTSGSFRSSKIGERPAALLILMSISLGLALASKWTAIYGIGILGGLYIINKFQISNFKFQISPRSLVENLLAGIIIFFLLPLIIYLITYLPFFTSGHTWAQFDELQHQMWWYHTRLKATHPFTSPWFSWPFDWRPVWYYVDYGISQISQIGQIGKPTVANIYGMGNPVVWWGGIIAIAAIIFKRLFQISNFKFQIVLAGYFGFFLPWALSPRIMFLYHYLPSVPFMCLGLGYMLDKSRNFKFQISNFKFPAYYLYLLLALLLFVYFYPHWSGLPVPKWLDESYYWFGSWR